VHKYLRPLLARIECGEIDPSFLITHRPPLEQAPEAYKMGRDKQEGCTKVVLTP
jgi:threonine dehydrogenase-like Zn-dependent dehydrogenase